MKTVTHLEVANDVAQFLAAGGTITTAKTSKRKTRMTATGKQKVTMTWRAPKFRPAVMWDGIETKQ